MSLDQLIAVIESATYVGRGYHIYDISDITKARAKDALLYFFLHELPLPEAKGYTDDSILFNWSFNSDCEVDYIVGEDSNDLHVTCYNAEADVVIDSAISFMRSLAASHR